jgi:alkylhydroperoxidase family enzyme
VARIEIPDGEGLERRRIWELSPEVGAALGSMTDAVYTKTTLDVRVRETARIRVAQINRCHI